MLVTGTLAIKPDLTYTGDTEVGSAPLKTVADALAMMTFDGVTLTPELMVADIRTLASGANETHDLTAIGEALAGKSVAFANILALAVVADAANVTQLTIGNAASNSFTGPLGGTTPTLTLDPGAGHLLMAPAGGWTVDATHKMLKVANAAGATATYTLFIIGNA